MCTCMFGRYIDLFDPLTFYQNPSKKPLKNPQKSLLKKAVVKNLLKQIQLHQVLGCCVCLYDYGVFKVCV